MPTVTITPEQTPNPNAIKFNVDQQLHDDARPRTFYTREAAQTDDLARALFELKHVTGVMVSNRFITVSKAPEGKWRTLRPKLLAIIESSFETGD